MEKYKKIALERKIEGLEDTNNQKDLILNKVNKNSRINIFNKPIFIMGLLLIMTIMSILPNIQDDKFSIIKVSANNYTLKVFDEDVKYELFTLVKNDIVKFNEEYSYYKDMKSHIDVSDITKVTAESYNGINILEIEVLGNDIIYLEVYESNDYLTIKELNYNFSNFKKQIKTLSEMLKKYPPIEEVEDKGDYKYYRFKFKNDLSGYDDSDIELYKWYVTRMGYLTRSVKVESFATLIHLDGTVNEPGKIEYISNTFNYPKDMERITMPLLVNNDEIAMKAGSLREDNDINVFHYISGSKFEGVAYSSFIIDFSNSIYDVSTLDVDITMNDNESVSENDMLILGDKLYVFPQKLAKDSNNDIYISIKVDIINGKEKILSLNYDDEYNFQPYN